MPPMPPFSNSSGISQNPKLTSLGAFNSGQRLQLQSGDNALMFSSPNLPSQTAGSRLSMDQDIYNKRAASEILQSRNNRNPITESFQYMAYRTKQAQQHDSQMWPADLEDAFLDAFLDVPKLGKLMFCINGKPHGRNQLIALYLWIAYVESLPPGVQPDETKRRTHKQVSSHIQVLKGYMRGHPAYLQLFPPTDERPNYNNKNVLNSDPCLLALSNNKLPFWRSTHRLANTPSMQPYLIDLYRTISKGSNQYERIHEYAEPKPLRLGPNSLEESLPNWRRQFPQMEHDLVVNDVGCSVMHVQTSLALQHVTSLEKAELRSRFEIAISENDDRLKWRCIQTVHHPKSLFDTGLDPPVSNSECPLSVDSFDDDTGPTIRVAFSALLLAHALEEIDHLQELFEDGPRGGHHHQFQVTALQYIRQLTMYQEISSSADYGGSWTKRAIIVWTFKNTKQGERGQTTWQYLDISPWRQMTISAQPGPCQEMQATVRSNHSSLHHTKLLSICPVCYGSMPNGLVTPTDTSDPQSPFSQYDYPVQQDLNAENMSLVSHNAQEGDETLVLKHETTQQMSYFFGSNPAISHSFEQEPSTWQAEPSIYSYESDAFIPSQCASPSTGGASQDFQNFLGNWRAPRFRSGAIRSTTSPTKQIIT